MGLRFFGRPPTERPILPCSQMNKAVGIVENHRLVRVRQNLTQGGNARRETPLDVLGGEYHGLQLARDGEF